MDTGPAPDKSPTPPGAAAPGRTMRSAVATPPTPEGILHVAVVTPEGPAFQGEAATVVVPGHDGEVGFFPQHAAFLGALGYGTLRIRRPDGTVERFLLEGGVVQVLANRVTVLAERVTPAARVDASAAERDLEAALRTVPTDDEAFARRDEALESARARLALVRSRS